MPETKRPYARFKVINDCLTSKTKYWSTDMLLERMYNIDIDASIRTLREDVRLMKECEQLRFYAPIKFSREKGGYYYTDPNYSFDKLPLTESDIEALELANTTLKQFREIPAFQNFMGTVDKLIGLVNHVKHTQHATHFSFIDFEKAPFTKGYEHLEILIEAIKNKRVIETTYQKFDGAPKVHTLSPYFLKEYRNRWYLLGKNHKYDKIITLALDRIQFIQISSTDVYRVSDSFNPDIYFKNTLGITYSEEDPEEIILSFTPSQGQYLKTQYLHDSQEVIVDNESEFRIRLLLTPCYELISCIMSYGIDVKVVAPQSLRIKISEIIKTCYTYYHN